MMTQTTPPKCNLIWWGRGDPAYSRNAVVREALQRLGWSLFDAKLNKMQALGLGRPADLPRDAALVWVPCFRQRDVMSAARFAKMRSLPLVFDPLISAYDKQVNERRKFAAESRRAQRLLAWEKRRFAQADLILADTRAHADYFSQTFGVAAERTAAVPVGADERLFEPASMRPAEGRRLRVLFVGSFIDLQGPEVIARAASLCPEADWVLLGDGPLRASCERLAVDQPHVSFEPWTDFAKLPAAIASADILLGVFSASDKAGRVVPNKVYQAMACARPVVTRSPLPGATPWPSDNPTGEATGVITIRPDDAAALAGAVRSLASEPRRLEPMGNAARATFEAHGTTARVAEALGRALDQLGLASHTTRKPASDTGDAP
ncbi:MAG: glycosyltransferase [Phycisphaeraceae bacterium]